MGEDGAMGEDGRNGAGAWPITSLALDVAGGCNLACRYCAEAATMPRRRPMSPEVVEAALDLLARRRPPGAPASLRFGSGEPLLALPLLRRAAEAAARRWPRPQDRPALFLTTNGTLVDGEAAAWLAAAGWHVKVSLDGPAPLHDAWRVTPGGAGTFAAAAAAASALARLVPPERLSATAVVCRGSDPAQVFDALAALGVRRIELVPVAHGDPAVLPAAADVARYRRFVFDYARRVAAGGDADGAGAPPLLIRLATRVTRAMGYNNAGVPCGAGRGFMGVAADGGLYPCFRFIGIAGYRLGDLAGGIDPGAAAAFRRGAGRPTPERPPCRDCWAAALCGGPCFAVAETFGPGDGQPLALHCQYTQADARAALWLVRRLRRRDPRRLLSFVPPAALAAARLAGDARPAADAEVDPP